MSVNRDMVVLVDEDDGVIGHAPKLEVHRKGLLHRAISVFLVNPQGDLLLQRRSESKYHSPGLWSNSCCSHPFLQESVLDAATRRLSEEMGIVAELKFLFSFIYRSEVGNSLVEHEFDHVFFGISAKSPKINLEEVSDYRWISFESLREDLELNPGIYTVWLKIMIDRFYDRFVGVSIF